MEHKSKAFSTAVRSDEIPRKQERLILSNCSIQFDRIFIKCFFRDTDRVAKFIGFALVLRVLWSATCRKQAVTAQQIANTIGMPRATVLRKLIYLKTLGHIAQTGSKYTISDGTLLRVTPALDQAVHLILESADALREVQNGQENP
jgi:hypothetical protein